MAAYPQSIANPRTGLNHGVGVTFQIPMQQSSRHEQDAHGNVDHRAIRRSKRAILRQASNHWSICRAPRAKAVEGGTMLTEIAERSELPLSAVVLSVHPGHPSEGGWPVIHVTILAATYPRPR